MATQTNIVDDLVEGVKDLKANDWDTECVSQETTSTISGVMLGTQAAYAAAALFAAPAVVTAAAGYAVYKLVKANL